MLRVVSLTILSAVLGTTGALAQLTNHAEIRPGLYFDLWKRPFPPSPDAWGAGGWGTTNLFQAGDMINYQISCTRTQPIIVGRLPQHLSFVLDLRDISGKPVPKTRFGGDNSKPVDPEKKRARDLKVKNLGPVTPTSWIFREGFRPDDYFVITNKGVYTLEAQIRVWTQRTNDQYGVVLSQPVRVQVEKR